MGEDGSWRVETIFDGRKNSLDSVGFVEIVQVHPQKRLLTQLGEAVDVCVN